MPYILLRSAVPRSNLLLPLPYLLLTMSHSWLTLSSFLVSPAPLVLRPRFTVAPLFISVDSIGVSLRFVPLALGLPAVIINGHNIVQHIGSASSVVCETTGESSLLWGIIQGNGIVVNWPS